MNNSNEPKLIDQNKIQNTLDNTQKNNNDNNATGNKPPKKENNLILEKNRSIIFSLKKPVNQKNNDDLQEIINFFISSNLGKNLIINRIPYENITTAFSQVAKYTKFVQYPKNKSIYKIGDYNDKFYIIIQGSVKYLKMCSDLEFLSGIEYYQLLMKYYQNNELVMLDNTINANSGEFKINYNDIVNGNLRMCVLKYCIDEYFHGNFYQMRKKEYTLTDILNECMFPLDENELTFFNVSNINYKFLFNNQKYLDDLKKIVYKKLTSISTSPTKPFAHLEKYTKFKPSSIKFKLTYFYKEIINDYEVNNFFGDETLLEIKYLKNSEIITSENTFLLELDDNYFYNFIYPLKEKAIERESLFLTSTFYFKSINANIFKTNYLYYFKYEEKKMNDILVTENQEINYIYFIKEGSVDLYINNISLLDLLKLIETLSKYNSTYFNSIKQIKEKLKDENIILTEKFKFKIFIFDQSFSLGNASVLLGNKYLYSAKVKSKELKYYKIKNEFFSNIINDKQETYDIFENDTIKELNLFCERLIELFEMKIKSIKQKYYRNNIEIMNLNDSKKEINKNSICKALFKDNLCDIKKKLILNKNKIKLSLDNKKVKKGLFKNKNKFLCKNLSSSVFNKNYNMEDLKSSIINTTREKNNLMIPKLQSSSCANTKKQNIKIKPYEEKESTLITILKKSLSRDKLYYNKFPLSCRKYKDDINTNCELKNLPKLLENSYNNISDRIKKLFENSALKINEKDETAPEKRDKINSYKFTNPSINNKINSNMSSTLMTFMNKTNDSFNSIPVFNKTGYKTNYKIISKKKRDSYRKKFSSCNCSINRAGPRTNQVINNFNNTNNIIMGNIYNGNGYFSPPKKVDKNCNDNDNDNYYDSVKKIDKYTFM